MTHYSFFLIMGLSARLPTSYVQGRIRLLSAKNAVNRLHRLRDPYTVEILRDWVWVDREDCYVYPDRTSRMLARLVAASDRATITSKKTGNRGSVAQISAITALIIDEVQCLQLNALAIHFQIMDIMRALQDELETPLPLELSIPHATAQDKMKALFPAILMHSTLERNPHMSKYKPQIQSLHSSPYIVAGSKIMERILMEQGVGEQSTAIDREFWFCGQLD